MQWKKLKICDSNVGVAIGLSGVTWWRKWAGKANHKKGKRKSIPAEEVIFAKAITQERRGDVWGFARRPVWLNNNLGGHYFEMKMERWTGRALASVLQVKNLRGCLSRFIPGSKWQSYEGSASHYSASYSMFVCPSPCLLVYSLN